MFGWRSSSTASKPWPFGRSTATTPWSWVATAMSCLPSPYRSAISASRIRLNLPPKSFCQSTVASSAPAAFFFQAFTIAALPPSVSSRGPSAPG